MFYLGVANLRCLESVEPIQIRPITVLVGMNSSGKSTFLRCLPLLRQSITTRTSSPLLWYGDWVDFDSFESSVGKSPNSSKISFTFGSDEIPRTTYGSPTPSQKTAAFKNVRMEVAIGKSEEVAGTVISSMRLTEESSAAEFIMSVNPDGSVQKLTLEGRDFNELTHYFDDRLNMKLSPGSILPKLQIDPDIPESLERSLMREYGLDARTLKGLGVEGPELRNLLNAFFSRSSRPSLGALGAVTFEGAMMGALEKAVQPALRKARPNTGEGVKKGLEALMSLDRLTREDFAGHSDPLIRSVSNSNDPRAFQDVRSLLLLRLLPHLVNATSQHLDKAFSSTLYIGPARARSDRYYRYQDLSVSEIDPDGKNLPMFLNSLTHKQIDEFSNWVNEWFDFRVQVTRSPGHISLTLLTGMGEVNIVDTGFGISQVLPVLAQIWWASRRNEIAPGTNPQSGHYSPIIAIEQPELHLHPAHQSVLADVLAGSIKAATQSRLQQITHFLIETHSDAIVNRLGALIAEHQIRPEDVNIIIFGRQGNRTKTSVSSFNDDGELVDWPYGFLSPVILP